MYNEHTVHTSSVNYTLLHVRMVRYNIIICVSRKNKTLMLS